MDSDRLRGMLLGLALGDALGTTLEFSPRDSQPTLSDMIGGGPFRLRAGEWTDDTSMALCLAETLVKSGQPDGSFDAAQLMRRFVNWWQFGDNSVTGECFDIGVTTRDALTRFQRNGDPFAGSEDPMSAGNGSIMRLAPVAMRWHMDPAAAGRAAEAQSRTTHAAAECLDACHLMTHMLIALADGAGLMAALRDAPTPFGTRIGTLRDGGFARMPREEIRSSGYVLHTLEAALWAVHGANDPREALLRAVNLGDDADTVGAVAGQFAGAIWGAGGLPQDWLARLAWRDRIEDLAGQLVTP